MNRTELAQTIDHTLLKPESTPEQVADLIAEAAELGTYSVCVSPSLLPVSAPESVKVATVCGFPSGAVQPEIKAAEAALSARQGADEVDMVINIANAVRDDFDAVEADIRAVRDAIPDTLLKVILETAALSDEQITQ